MSELKITSVNLDPDIVDEAKRKGYNVSEECRNALQILVSDEFNDVDIGLKIEILVKQSEQMDNDLNNVHNTISQLNNRKNCVSEEIKILRSQQIAIRNSNMLNKLTGILNKSIITNKFDINIIKLHHDDIIRQIQTIKPEFEIEHHVNRMKQIMDA